MPINDIIIKKSKISGKGVFAKRNFSKGEIILKWKPKLIKKSEIEKLSKRNRTFIQKIGKNSYLMQAPERYVNHSCDPNTIAKNKSDIAARNIKRGEEITSDYSGQGAKSFKCECGGRTCKNFFITF